MLPPTIPPLAGGQLACTKSLPSRQHGVAMDMAYAQSAVAERTCSHMCAQRNLKRASEHDAGEQPSQFCQD